MNFADKLKGCVDDMIFVDEVVEFTDRYNGNSIKVIIDKIMIGTESVNGVLCDYPDQYRPFITAHYHPMQASPAIKKEVKHYLAYFKKIQTKPSFDKE